MRLREIAKTFRHIPRRIRCVCCALVLLVAAVADSSACAETRQRIDYSTAWLGIDQYETDAELFTTPTEDNSVQVSPVFRVKVSQTVRSLPNGNVKLARQPNSIPVVC